MVTVFQVSLGYLEVMIRRDLHPRDAVPSGVNEPRRAEEAVWRPRIHQQALRFACNLPYAKQSKDEVSRRREELGHVPLAYSSDKRSVLLWGDLMARARKPREELVNQIVFIARRGLSEGVSRQFRPDVIRHREIATFRRKRDHVRDEVGRSS